MKGYNYPKDKRYKNSVTNVSKISQQKWPGSHYRYSSTEVERFYYFLVLKEMHVASYILVISVHAVSYIWFCYHFVMFWSIRKKESSRYIQHHLSSYK